MTKCLQTCWKHAGIISANSFVCTCRVQFSCKTTPQVRTVTNVYPTQLIIPARNPMRIAPHGWITMLASVPTATPPARVEFCMCT